MTYAREQHRKCSEEIEFCNFFYAFEIKEWTNVTKIRESQAGIGFQDN